MFTSSRARLSLYACAFQHHRQWDLSTSVWLWYETKEFYWAIIGGHDRSGSVSLLDVNKGPSISNLCNYTYVQGEGVIEAKLHLLYSIDPCSCPPALQGLMACLV